MQTCFCSNLIKLEKCIHLSVFALDSALFKINFLEPTCSTGCCCQAKRKTVKWTTVSPWQKIILPLGSPFCSALLHIVLWQVSVSNGCIQCIVNRCMAFGFCAYRCLLLVSTRANCWLNMYYDHQSLRISQHHKIMLVWFCFGFRVFFLQKS